MGCLLKMGGSFHGYVKLPEGTCNAINISIISTSSQQQQQQQQQHVQQKNKTTHRLQVQDRLY